MTRAIEKNIAGKGDQVTRRGESEGLSVKSFLGRVPRREFHME